MGRNQRGSALRGQQKGFRLVGFGAGRGMGRGRESRLGRLRVGGELHKLPHVTSQGSSASPRSQRLAIAAPHGEAAPRVGCPTAAPRRRPQLLSLTTAAAPASSLRIPVRALRRARRRGEGQGSRAASGGGGLCSPLPPRAVLALQAGRQGCGEWGLFWGVCLSPAHFPHLLSARGRERS